MRPSPKPDEEDAYRRARASFAASYMSDAKWRRVFAAIARAGVVIEEAEWRFIDTERTAKIGLPAEADLYPTRLSDGRFQCLEYRWIRSIHVPRDYRPITDVGFTRTQDIMALRSAIESAGRFQYSEDENGLTIFGYG